MMLLLVSKLPAKSIYHSSMPLAPTRIKKKNPALGAEKTGLACEYINGNDNGFREAPEHQLERKNGNYFVPCPLSLCT